MPDNLENIRRIASFLWDIAQDIHGAVAKSENQNIILPLVVLRRLDYALLATKPKVLETETKLKAKGLENRHEAICRAAGFSFYNTHPKTLDDLLDDDANLARRLRSYIHGFSENVREIFHRFRFDDAIRSLDEVDRLYLVLTRFNEKSRINLAPKSEPSEPDRDTIKLGSTLAKDQFGMTTFDLQFANPPYGYKWEADKAAVTAEAGLGHYARFGAGLPRISDGQLLFLQHMLHHVNRDAPSHIGIVFNGSPLFTGEAGSGEAEIRRWILEKDWLVALVALPEQMFYNTGIQTYLWILTTRKTKKQAGKVMLFDASGERFWKKLPKAIGDKRRTIEGAEDAILREFHAWKESGSIKIFPSTAFGYRRIQIDRPLRLSFEITAERLARLQAAKPFAELVASKNKEKAACDAEIAEGRQLQQEILSALHTLPPGPVKCAAHFGEMLDAALKTAGLKPKKPVIKAILDTLSERDETAEPVVAETTAIHRSELPERLRRAELNHRAPETPRYGGFHLDHPDEKNMLLLTRYEADNELKDFENVPLGTDIGTYFEREVLPHAPDAWISPEFTDEKDSGIGEVGYEINFNRHFYTYQPPRPVAAIDEDIRKVEKNILAMLKEVMG